MHYVQILLSTFNGESYLREQLTSIAKQSHSRWSLLIRDDGSNDSTLGLIEEFRGRADRPVEMTADSGNNLGPAQSFGSLIASADSDYLMLCDQDDVWMPEKIERSLGLLLETENRLGKHVPVLVHTDLQVVDNSLEELARSFIRHQVLTPTSSLNRLLVQNSVTGCTVIFNRALKELCGLVPPQAIMHDWWLALVAAAFGAIVFLDEPTMLYRQHGKNRIGAKRFDAQAIIARARDLDQMKDSLRCTQLQANSFLRTFDGSLSGEQREVLIAYSNLGQGSLLEKWATIAHYGFWKSSLARNLGLLISI